MDISERIDDLFFEATIERILNTPLFVKRIRLAQQVLWHLSQEECRFLLITAPPGAGKSAFLAWLAAENKKWMRYFLRLDNRTALAGRDAHSLLFSLGHQFAALSPESFDSEDIDIEVVQRVETIEAGGSATGIRAKSLAVSPFRKTAIKVQQEGDRVAGDLTGIVVESMVLEPRFLEVDKLQYLALVEPARALLQNRPNAKIVILIDALDESRAGSATETVIDWLAACPELPPNVRIILTSRPDLAELELFRAKQAKWLQELFIDPDSDDVQNDIRRYLEQFLADEEVESGLEAYSLTEAEFMRRVTRKALGNFLYLTTVCQGIVKAIEKDNAALLGRLLTLEDLPEGLGDLYFYFLSLIRNDIAKGDIIVKRRTSGLDSTEMQASAWKALYLPILGLLTVAQEGITVSQIRDWGNLGVAVSEIAEAIENLSQFLLTEVTAVGVVARLYHRSFAEFLTSADTITQHPKYYVDPQAWHRAIASYYRGLAPSWSDLNWSEVDTYGLRYLSYHLLEQGNDTRAREELYRLICRPFMEAKFAQFGSHHSFATDLDRVIQAAKRENPINLLQILRASYLLAIIRSLADNVPPELVAAMSQLARDGQAEDSAGIVALQTDPMARSENFRRIASSLIAKGEIPAAREHLEQALEETQLISDPSKRFAMLAEVAKTMAEAGYLEGAHSILDILDSMLPYLDLPEGAVLPHIPEEKTVWSVLKILALSGDGSNALARADGRPAAVFAQTESGVSTLRDNALRQIARPLAENGDFEMALRASILIHWPNLAAEALCELAEVAYAAGEHVLANEAVELAKERTLEIRTFFPIHYPNLVEQKVDFVGFTDMWLRIHVAMVLAKLGKRSDAQEMAKHVVALILDEKSSPDDPPERGMDLHEYLRKGVVALAWSGLPEDAIQLVEEVPERLDNVPRARVGIARALLDEGRLEEATEIAFGTLSDMQSSGAGYYYVDQLLLELIEIIMASGEIASVDKAVAAIDLLPHDDDPYLSREYVQSRSRAARAAAHELAKMDEALVLELLNSTIETLDETPVAKLLIIAQALAETDNSESLALLVDAIQNKATATEKAGFLEIITQAMVALKDDLGLRRLLTSTQRIVDGNIAERLLLPTSKEVENKNAVATRDAHAAEDETFSSEKLTQAAKAKSNLGDREGKGQLLVKSARQASLAGQQEYLDFLGYVPQFLPDDGDANYLNQIVDALVEVESWWPKAQS